MRNLRWSRSGVAAVAAILLLVSPAGAQGGGGRDTDWAVDQNGPNTVDVNVNGREGRRGGTSSPAENSRVRSPYDNCTTQTLTPDQARSTIDEYARYDNNFAHVGGTNHFTNNGPAAPTENVTVTTCVVGNQAFITMSGPGGPDPQVIIDFLIDEAYRMLTVPYPTPSSAPEGTPGTPLITQLDTWLWLDDGIWTPVSATPPTIFGITVTATATPANVTFSGGGDTVDCGANEGAPYDFSLAEDAQSTTCSLMYTDSSSVADHHLTADVSWDVTYVCTPGCGSGSLPALTLSDTVGVTVAELQALVVNP